MPSWQFIVNGNDHTVHAKSLTRAIEIITTCLGVDEMEIEQITKSQEQEPPCQPSTR